MLCNGLINTGSLGHFPPAIEELQGPQVQALIISLYSMIGIFGKLVLGWLNDRFGVVASTAFGCITFALSFIFILFGQNISMLYIMASSSAWEMLSAPSPLRLLPPPSLALKNTGRHTESPTALHKSAFPWERSWWLPYMIPAALTTQLDSPSYPDPGHLRRLDRRIYRIQKVLPKACGGQYAEYAGRAIKPEAKRLKHSSMPEWFEGASFSFVLLFHLYLILYSAT